MRRTRATKENVQRIARLYQVDQNMKDPSRLWKEEDVNQIRRGFFEGNSTVRKQRAPGTLKAPSTLGKCFSILCRIQEWIFQDMWSCQTMTTNRYQPLKTSSTTG